MSARWMDFSLAGLWFVTDQLTKVWASQNLETPIVVLPSLFHLSLSHNRGALFGIMADWPDPLRWVLLAALPMLAIVFIGYLLAQTPQHERWTRLGLALILGGAAGNVVDRLRLGYVVDFLDVHCDIEPIAGLLRDTFGSTHWPTFNVADSGLTIGASLILLQLVRRRSAERGTHVPASD